MSNEFCLLDLTAGIDSLLVQKALARFSEWTHEICPVVTPESLAQNQWLNDLSPHIRNICMRLPLESERSKSEALAGFELIKKNIKASRYFVELILEDSKIPELYTTLSRLESAGVSAVFLDPRQLKSGDSVNIIREAFELLRTRQQTAMNIHFYPEPKRTYWNSQTKNLFSGPARVDIDIANTCTHNCVFCSLYSPEAMAGYKKSGGGRLDSQTVKFMSLRIDREKCLQIIDSLPFTVKNIQFGGAGDPFTHPHMIEFIRAARQRGFLVEVLTNFSYLTIEDITELHEMSGRGQIRLCVNLSAATPETYSRVRPNQDAETFAAVLQALKTVAELKERDKVKARGIYLLLISVVNELNYHEMAEFTTLGKQVGAEEVWLKPIEIHSETHLALVPGKKDMASFKKELSRAIACAHSIGVDLYHEELLDFLSNQNDSLQADPTSDINQIGTVQGSVLGSIYKKIPCRIGYHYIRFRVDGSLLPCCIAEGKSMGSTRQDSWKQIWFSDNYGAFRTKTERIHKDRFHLKDPDWAFCQQCTHIDTNMDASFGDS